MANFFMAHSDAFCIPRSYLRDGQPERPISSWLARNLTWPTAGKYRSKPFLPGRVSLPRVPQNNFFIMDLIETFHILKNEPFLAF